MDYQEALNILTPLHQEKLLEYWEDLSSIQQQNLLSQIEKLHIPTLQMQQELLLLPEHHSRSILPFTNYTTAGSKQDFETGKEMIARGLVGCLIVAGGQGTRLRLDGPKGICPVTKIRHKNLFQLFAEKVIAAGKQAQRLLPLAIMTSPLNHNATVTFFENNRLFGLDPSQLSFFTQETLPFLDDDGNLFLQSPDSIAEGPDGNGGALHQFFHQGIWNEWHGKGVNYMNFVLIDNPLADPFDAELVGRHQRVGGDVIIKATPKSHPKESVGVLAKEGNHTVVIEYTELGQNERTATQPDGSLVYSLANISLFSFSMDFIKRLATNSKHPMPLHRAHKDTVKSNIAKPLKAWKFEKFIFDVLPQANGVEALVYPRERCFAPLKQFSGDNSIETVASAIEANDRYALESITGMPCTISPLEVAQEFYYPTPNIIKTWHNRSVTQVGYIETGHKNWSEI